MRHRHHEPHKDYTKPDLPITPMLDMSFQLLAFFIITFKPASTEGQLALTLPKSGEDTTLTAPPDPTKLPDEPEEVFVVRVQANRDGNISGLELVVPKVADPIKFEDDKPDGDNRPKELKLREELLKRVEEKKAAKQPVPKLEYQFAETLNYQLVIRQLDEAKQAKFEKVVPTLLVYDKPKPPAK